MLVLILLIIALGTAYYYSRERLVLDLEEPLPDLSDLPDDKRAKVAHAIRVARAKERKWIAKKGGRKLDHPENREGWVYVMIGSAEGIEGPVVKVGYTRWSPRDRAKSLRTLGSYRGVKWRVHDSKFVSSCYEVEQRTHELLRAEWIRGELFRVSPSAATEAIRRADVEISNRRQQPTDTAPRVENSKLGQNQLLATGHSERMDETAGPYEAGR